MRLISKVTIESFRSIRKAGIEGLGDFTALAGLNNSGKSNVLRALHAFFTERTEPDRLISVDGDFYRPDLRNKKRKKITITVNFTLPQRFTFRKGLEFLEDLLGGRSFQVAKEWTRDQFLPVYYLNGQRLDRDGQQKVEQFLQLIKFRYVPNRVLPTEVIRGEHAALRDVLIRRLGREAHRQKAGFEAIRKVSESLIEALAKRFNDSCPTEGSVRLGTPTSWHDMVFTFGYRLVKGDIEIDDIFQGSGIQSLLMLETLHLIDRDYFQQFGWRQAAVWAIEEPESSLHSSLEARMASFLSTIASEKEGRLQILATTHSDLMLQHADKAVIVSQRNNESVFDDKVDKREALDRLAREGVSRWVHPLLFYPLDPIILVEGKFDKAFLDEALKHIKPSREVRITYLAELESDGATGGIDALRNYIKQNKDAIRARQLDAPVVVLLDWDSSNKRTGFQNLVIDQDRYSVLVWPDEALNPNLGKDFRGIERVYANRIIDKGIDRGAAIERTMTGKYVVTDKDNYSKIKVTFSEIVREGLVPDDLAAAKPFLRQVLEASKSGS